MKKLIIYPTLLLILTGLFACHKILDKVDLNGIPDEEVWATDGTAELYLNTLYSNVMPVFYSNAGSTTIPSNFHNISDECNGGTNVGVIQGTLTTESEADFYSSASAGYYPYIRKINYLLDGLSSNAFSTAEAIRAQAYYLRAWAYFQLWKIYGGVPYITTAQDWITDSLNVARSSSSQCVDSMLADLSHCSVLQSVYTGNDQGRITNVAALALKARILLYWASPQFNPSSDGTRWNQAYEANEAAYDSLTAAGYALYSNYSRIFLDASNASNKEVIFFRSYNGTTTVSSLYNNWENSARPYSQSAGGGGKSYNPTWNLVKAYPMADGYPSTNSSANYPYNDSFYWKNRDPRFYSTIVYNGAVYGTGSTAGRKQWQYPGMPEDKNALTTTGFYCRKNIDTTIAAANATYGKTWWVEMRLGEVMLNLAECANATGHQDEAYNMLIAIRKRAGIKANSDNLYGLTAGMTQAQMETAILAERQIELAFEDKRNDDLRRSRTFDQLNTTYRNQLVITINGPYFTSTASKDTSNVNNLEHLIPGTQVKMRDTIDVDNTEVYKKFFSTSVAPISGDLAINFLTNYYFYAIPSSNISKQPALQQTIGWNFSGAAGTFDPTK